MIGLTIEMPLFRNSRSLASCVAPSMLLSVRVRLLDAHLVVEAVGDEVLAHFLAAAQLVDETLIEPGLVDLQVRIGEQPVAVEALDVVALVGAAIAPDVDAVVAHRHHEGRAGDRAPERRGVEVGGAAGADVERAALDGGNALVDQLRPAIDQARDLGAIGLGFARDVVVVGLIGLAEVGRVGARDRALGAHPVHRGRGVEPAGKRDADALAGGQGLQDRGGH